jgi:hypothetical protein
LVIARSAISTTPAPQTFYWNCVRQWYCDTYDTGNETLPACDPRNTTSEVYDFDAEGLCREAADCTCSPPWSYVSRETLPAFWRVAYWVMQLMTWIVLPLTESYMSAGDFTFGQKLKASLKENGIIYATGLAIFGGLFIYLLASKRFGATELQEIAMAASNVWGMILLVVMLGYGLVDIPRFLWRRSDYDSTLRLCVQLARRGRVDVDGRREGGMEVGRVFLLTRPPSLAILGINTEPGNCQPK